MRNLRELIRALRQQNEIVEIDYPVDPHLELAEIHRRVAAANGPALLFKNVKGSSFPVATNLFGTLKRMEIAFGKEPEAMIQKLVHLIKGELSPSLKTLWQERSLVKRLLSLGMKKERHSPVREVIETEPDLEKLPLLKLWPMDGGSFVTLPLVYTENPVKGAGAPNLGMYRLQRFDKKTTGLHCQIGKGGGYHYISAEAAGQPLPVHVFLGGPPALMLSAILPLPENVPELLFASLVMGGKIGYSTDESTGYPVIGECEFVLTGRSQPHVRRLEGPFGDHYGYYSLEHEFPVFECEKIYHRKDAIYPATVVGKPRQEDYYIGEYLQNLLSPLFPIVMPGLKALWSYGETGFHSLAAAVVEERFYRESMKHAFRILGEGQLSLTKFLLLTDQPVELKDFKKTLTTILERFQPETDLFIFSELSYDTLDYTGPALNQGSRGVMLGVGQKKRDLPKSYRGPSLNLRGIEVFCPGCLVVDGTDCHLADLLKREELSDWPLIILVDDAKEAASSITNFLWTVFTRFEPAADIYAQSTEIHRHHLMYRGPIGIDARFKKSYPPIVAADEATADTVSKNWQRYFSKGMEMGDSEKAHLSSDI
ncbi:MAG: 4-hydroxybenzoate decarboxylase [Chlamydiales bacterium]|nr:4-hydroxybenzoate decarboxylase [Chlamydiales bacterium]